jgi:UDP-N-acetylglucosamine:LPS N-acetylglucosamine transferase
LVTEKNDFGKTWYVQTLLQYNPNPFTIFYVGGSTGYSLVDTLNTSYQADSNQVYVKFQYMFDF